MSQGLNFNIFNIIILIGVFQGFVFGFMVFFNKNYRIPTNYFLVFTALALSFNNLQYLVLDIGIVESLYFQFPFEFIIMPMFYIFVNMYLKIRSNRRDLILIFLPFLLSLLFRIIVKLNLFSFSEAIIRLLVTAEEFLSLFFSCLMIILILRRIYRYERSKVKFNLLEIKAKTKWLKQALFIGITTCVFWLFVIKDSIARFEKDLSVFYPLWIIISILVYWIVYKGIVQTRILNQRFDIRNDTINSLNSAKNLFDTNDNLFVKIEGAIISEKLFLNPNLSLDVIADRFDVSVSHLSRVISKNSEYSFTDFINKLRINESKKMLTNEEYKNYTIEAIGYESGFNSKSNFYTAFKKETQTTPSTYRLGK